MGYPNPVGHQPHQGYASGYGPYPNEYPPPHQQPYSYAANPYYADQAQTYPAGSGGGFIRGFILCSCLIFTIFFISAIAMALVMKPEVPVFKVVSLSVENFNTATTLNGNWNTVFTVENPSQRLRGFFSDFKLELVYKRDQIAGGYTLGFELGRRDKRQMEVRFMSSNVAGVDLNGMAKERESGSVTFSMKISSMTALRSTHFSPFSPIYRRGESLLVTCEGLKVVFQNNTGNGAMNTGSEPIACKS